MPNIQNILNSWVIFQEFGDKLPKYSPIFFPAPPPPIPQKQKKII